MFHYLYISHFIYPFIHWWTFICFCILAIVNNTAMNLLMQIFFLDSDFFSFRCIARSGIADHVVFLFLSLGGKFRLFSTVAIPICLFTSSAQCYLSSTSSPALAIFYLFDKAFLTGVRCCLTVVLIYMSPKIVAFSFSHTYWSFLYAFFGKMSIQFSCPANIRNIL